MSGPEVKVLVVVQEAMLAGAISRALLDAGFTPHWAAYGQGALEMAGHQPYSAFIVELVLPDMLGVQLVHALRKWGRCAPALLLGGRTALLPAEEADPTIFLLPKPFVMGDLVSHVRAMAGSSVSLPPESVRPLAKAASPPPGRLTYGHLVADPQTRAVSREGRSVALTEREFAVLGCLMRRPEEVVSKAELAQAVWGDGEGARSNVLEVYINFLRRKIDQGFDRKLLHTVRGAGYVLRAES
jgi:two-component system, OmpR family, response regulator